MFNDPFAPKKRKRTLTPADKKRKWSTQDKIKKSERKWVQET